MPMWSWMYEYNWAMMLWMTGAVVVGVILSVVVVWLLTRFVAHKPPQ